MGNGFTLSADACCAQEKVEPVKQEVARRAAILYPQTTSGLDPAEGANSIAARVILGEVAERIDAEPAEERRGPAPWLAVFLMTLAATAVVAPMFFLGDASGHDFQFHISSWMDAAHQWHEGIFYPRWAEWANWGYGEPRFIFYPPASWLIGAALGSVLPWAIAPTVYIWLTLVGGAIAMRRLACEWLSCDEAAAAGVFFALNPYNLVLVYYRSDFAELLAVALFPLLVFAVFRIGREGWRGAPFLAAVFAGVWLCDVPAAVIATYSVVLLLIVCCLLERKLRPLLGGGVAMICGFGFAAFYIVPVAWEQRWVQIAQAIDDNLQIERNFAFAHTNDPGFLFFNLKVSGVALGTVLVTAILAVFVARRRREFPPAWWMLVTLGTVSVFLLFSPSDIFWRLLPKLRFVQFPWRWQEALAVAFAFFAAAATPREHPRKRRMVWATVILLLGATATMLAADAWWDRDDVSDIAESIHSNLGYEGTDEYEPVGSDRWDLFGIGWQSEEPPSKPIPLATELDLVSDKVVPATGVRLHIERWTAERRILSEESEHPVNLVLRLLAYPAWEARVDGKATAISTAPAGQMVLRIPSGTHRIDLRFVRTWDRIAGEWISIFFGVVVFVWAGVGRIVDRKN
jgi:hypothetical protein